MLAGMDRADCDIFLLVIVHNLYVGRPGRMVGPRKTNAPLVIDADTVLSFAVTCQRFKPVTRQDGQVPKGSGRLRSG
jgi:hypothetical protein